MSKPASKPESKLLEIFRAGQHTDVSGRTWEFSAADMQAAVNAYDPALFAAPLVVGHPKLDDPAYGWVNKLELTGDLVTAEPKDVEAQFAALVNEKRFPKMSASWFPPTHPSNPKPGVWYLRHVGFLGAAAPAINGLKEASFASDDKDLATFDFAASHADEALWSLSRLARSMRDWMIGKFGLEEADQVIPDYVVRDVETQHTQAMADQSTARFAAVDTPTAKAPEPQPEIAPQSAQPSADFAARENSLAEREAALAAREAAANASTRLQECASFAEQLVTTGILLPREKEGFVAFAANIDDDSVVSFAAADGETATPKALDWFKGFMQAMPARVTFGEKGAADANITTASFAAPAGYSVNPERLELHNKALAYASQHKCDYNTAIAAVS